MKTLTAVPSAMLIRRVVRNICRRLMATTLFTTYVFVAPAIASLTHAPLHEVRLPRIDSRVVEGLQRWANDEKDSWCEES